MNKGTVFALCLACAALALGAIALLTATSMIPAAPASDGGVTICGIGNSGNNMSPNSSAVRLARKVKELDLTQEVKDQTLREILKAVEARALQGDAEAAAVVFELAAMERVKAAASQSSR